MQLTQYTKYPAILKEHTLRLSCLSLNTLPQFIVQNVYRFMKYTQLPSTKSHAQRVMEN